ncbi:MAG TPA: substrate-binding domain-containing protein [Armatimonadota bacterium]|jgi:hypothetical protein
MKPRNTGLLLLGLAALIVLAFTQLRGHGGKPGAGPRDAASGNAGQAQTIVKLRVGGEKIGFLEDPEVKDFLARRYGLAVDYQKAGSVAMVEGKTDGLDALWPSSQVTLQLYRNRHGGSAVAETIFNSPVVLYSTKEVTGALQRLGIVRVEQGTYYIVDMPRLIDLMVKQAHWKDLGLPQLNGRVTVFSTDPNQSNSGMMFSGLLANLLNGGDVVDETRISPLLPRLKKFFSVQGFMPTSSDDIFRNFLNVGDQPIIVGYESQLVEVCLTQPQLVPQLKDSIRTLYPRPTVWTQHPLIVLTPKGKQLLQALRDPELQQKAWRRHGFRSGSTSVVNDPAELQVTGVPAKVRNTMQMPNAVVMEKVLQALQPR